MKQDHEYDNTRKAIEKRNNLQREKQQMELQVSFVNQS
uniref:Uncharacterized protein n=1 Tax=Parascaris equorum TaxID=6256 RepID=A0A914S2X8_PAREQ